MSGKSKKAGKGRRQNTHAHARAPVARDSKGHFLPGVSGNPGGRPTEERELKELARSHGQEAIEHLVHLMRSAADERVQLGAAEALLTRGYGRPAESGGPLVAINFGAGAAAITDAHEASRMYAEIMGNPAIDLSAIDVTPSPALPAPREPAHDRRVEAIDIKPVGTWNELAK